METTAPRRVSASSDYRKEQLIIPVFDFLPSKRRYTSEHTIDTVPQSFDDPKHNTDCPIARIIRELVGWMRFG